MASCRAVVHSILGDSNTSKCGLSALLSARSLRLSSTDANAFAYVVYQSEDHPPKKCLCPRRPAADGWATAGRTRPLSLTPLKDANPAPNRYDCSNPSANPFRLRAWKTLAVFKQQFPR